MSQEELADLLDVSRQAVSKWEQEMGCQEVEKLLLLSNKRNVSLDVRMSAEIVHEAGEENISAAGTIVIASPNERVIVACYKVTASTKLRDGKNAPQYVLFGVSKDGASFWGCE